MDDTMTPADLIAADAVVDDLKAGDKRRVLELLGADAAARGRLDAAAVVAALMHREELGSTGLGRGCAVPHARVPAVGTAFATFARLREPIAWEAIDDRPVDLVCLMLLPTRGEGSQPLAALACIARRLRDDDVLARIRQAKDAAGIHAALVAIAAPPVPGR